jgi:hypothetical protein
VQPRLLRHKDKARAARARRARPLAVARAHAPCVV